MAENTYQIVDGQHRWEVAKEAGFEELPVIVREMTESEAKAQTIAMNKLRGEMEPADVAALVKDIMGDINLDELATFSGFQLEELEAYVSLADFDFSEYDETGEDDDEGPSEEAWVTMTFRVPSDVEPIIRSEIERVKAALRTEHDSVALEAICVNSANSPIEDFIGGEA
jgi:ParB-like chromosome segregation protein Spo0J